MLKSVLGNVSIVTGGSRGLESAIAKILADQDSKESLTTVGANVRSRTLTSRNCGVAASARLFQDRILADSGSRPTVFNQSTATVRRAAASHFRPGGVGEPK